MGKYVVTITREFGSLGRPIARRMSELLNIEYYDREIVDRAAKALNLPVSIVSSQEEIVKSKFFSMQFPLGREAVSRQDEIFHAQKKVILEMADKESCIIVGRCSDYIINKAKNHISIYIYAPYEERLKNCIESLEMTEEVAKKMIAEVDKARESYHKRYAKFKPSDIRYKNLLIDSSTLGVEGTAQYLADLIRKKFEK